MVMAMTVFAAGITEDRAKEIALENAKVSQEDVSFIWTEVDYDHGRKIYDVEFFTKDYKEYDYEIDAENGTILEMDYDAEYELRDRREDRSRREGSAQADDLITAEEAKAAALKQVGLEDSQVRWGRKNHRSFLQGILDPGIYVHESRHRLIKGKDRRSYMELRLQRRFQCCGRLYQLSQEKDRRRPAP